MTSSLLLDCGSGGKASRRLIADLFFRHLGNEILATLDDAARLNLSGPLAMSTDAYTVTPPFFPGGSIGTLAVHGTVNDVAMLGAKPRYLSASFILEEGLDMDLLERIVSDMGEACRRAGVWIVTGDTKVVPRGACDKIFISTAGIGSLLVPPPAPGPSGSRAVPRDAILLSGSVGDHGLTILGQREQLSFLTGIQSDSAAVHHLVEAVIDRCGSGERAGSVHVLRDPTRGGLATTLNEIADQSGVTCVIEEKAIPIHGAVRSGCDILGLDPLYLANEGKFLCFLPEELVDEALATLRALPGGEEAARIGTVEAPQPGQNAQVILVTAIGGRRLLPMLEGDPLPRIC